MYATRMPNSPLSRLTSSGLCGLCGSSTVECAISSRALRVQRRKVRLVMSDRALETLGEGGARLPPELAADACDASDKVTRLDLAGKQRPGRLLDAPAARHGDDRSHHFNQRRANAAP